MTAAESRAYGRRMNQLDEYLKGRNVAAFAALLGVSRSHVWRLRTGKRFPSLAMARRIYFATGGTVPLSSWYDAPLGAADNPARTPGPATPSGSP